MTSLTEFLGQLFADGVVILRARPRLEAGERHAVLRLLCRAHADYRLDIAGPALDLDAETALAAAVLLSQACWFLVSRTEPVEELERCLALPGPPASPAQHLSADLTLRYLPQVHGRARALAPDDRLAVLLATVLRQWPLSGVLSQVEDEPLTPPEFGGHPGLLLLYAERLAQTEKPAWVPRGPAQEYVELVFADLGKRPPAPAAEEVTRS